MIRHVLWGYLRQFWIVIAVFGSLWLSLPFRSPKWNVPPLMFVPVVAIVVGLNLREQLAHTTARIIPHFNSIHVRTAFAICMLVFGVVPLGYVYDTSGIGGWLQLAPVFLLLGTLSLCLSYFLGGLAFFVVPALTIGVAEGFQKVSPGMLSAYGSVANQAHLLAAMALLLGFVYHRTRVSKQETWMWPLWNFAFPLSDKLEVLRDRLLLRSNATDPIPWSTFSKLKLDSALSLAYLLLTTVRTAPALIIGFLALVTFNVLRPEKPLSGGVLSWIALLGAWSFVRSYNDLGYELSRSVSRKTFVRAILLAIFGWTLLLNLMLFGATLVAALINPEVMRHINFAEVRYAIAVSCGLSPIFGVVAARSSTNRAFDWSSMLALWIGCSLLLALSVVIRERLWPFWSDYYGLGLVAAACFFSAYRTLLNADFT